MNKHIIFFRFSIFLMLWGSFIGKISAQEFPSYIASPTAAGLGKFGDTPVSYYTGTPDISIPLYKLSNDGIDLPVTLRYDASGVRVNSLPSWVGQNWSLEAGGVIVRSSRTYPDEYKYITNGTTIKFSNYFQSYSHLPQIYNKDQTLKDSVMWKDMEPDIYTFNFMGKTGKFLLGNDGEWKVESEHNIDVIFDIRNESNYANQFIEDIPLTSKKSKTIYGFRLRDDEGVTYEFGYNINAIEYTIDFFNQYYGGTYTRPVWTASSWYLTKVTDKYSNVIYDLTYKRGYFIAHLYNSYNYTTISSQEKGWGYEEYGMISQPPYMGGDLISPVYLSNIHDWKQDVEIDFMTHDVEQDIYSDYSKNIAIRITPVTPWYYYYLQSDDRQLKEWVYNWNIQATRSSNPLLGLKMKKLTSMIITAGRPVKMFNFNYNDKKNERLNLLEVTEKDLNVNNFGTYKFNYNNFSLLPADYLSKKADHWGYYNNRDYSLPGSDSEYNSFYQNRNSNSSNMLYGMLKEIIYPTGGKTIYEFEPHSYNGKMSLNRQTYENGSGIAGGARIKYITDYDEDGIISKRREFLYSGGILAAQPIYYWNRWEATPTNPSARSYVRIFHTSSIIPLANSFGPHIGYTTVTEKITGEGETVYKYSNFNEEKDAPPVKTLNSGQPSPYDRFCERGYKRGKLQEVYWKSQTGQTYTKKINYTYRTDNVENKYVLASNINTVFGSVSGGFTFYTGNVYKIYFPRYDVIKEVTEENLNNRYLRDTITYNKKDVDLTLNTNRYTRKVTVRVPTSITTSNPYFSETIHYNYSFDLSSAYMTDITQRFDIKKPLEVSVIRNGNTLVKYEQCTFRKLNNGLIVPDKFLTSNKDKNNLIEKISFLDYDAEGKLLYYQERGKPKCAIIWGYNKSNPIAIIEGWNSYTYPTTLGDKNLMRDEFIKRFKLLRSEWDDIKITGYTYDYNIGITSITDQNEKTTYYDYDSFGKLKEVYIMEGNVKKMLTQYSYNYKNK